MNKQEFFRYHRVRGLVTFFVISTFFFILTEFLNLRAIDQQIGFALKSKWIFALSLSTVVTIFWALFIFNKNNFSRFTYTLKRGIWGSGHAIVASTSLGVSWLLYNITVQHHCYKLFYSSEAFLTVLATILFLIVVDDISNNRQTPTAGKEDQLDRSQLVNKLTRFANKDYQLTTKRRVAALLGDNGCGKTFILKMLEEKLENSHSVVWFNPSQISLAEQEDRFYHQLSCAVTKNAILPEISFLPLNMSKAAAAVEDKGRFWGAFVQQARLLILGKTDSKVSDVLANYSEIVKPFVMMIDDLDRCTKTQRARLFHLINNLGDEYDGTFFVATTPAELVTTTGAQTQKEQAMERMFSMSFHIPVSRNKLLQNVFESCCKRTECDWIKAEELYIMKMADVLGAMSTVRLIELVANHISALDNEQNRKFLDKNGTVALILLLVRFPLVHEFIASQKNLFVLGRKSIIAKCQANEIKDLADNLNIKTLEDVQFSTPIKESHYKEILGLIFKHLHPSQTLGSDELALLAFLFFHPNKTTPDDTFVDNDMFDQYQYGDVIPPESTYYFSKILETISSVDSSVSLLEEFRKSLTNYNQKELFLTHVFQELSQNTMLPAEAKNALLIYCIIVKKVGLYEKNDTRGRFAIYSMFKLIKKLLNANDIADFCYGILANASVSEHIKESFIFYLLNEDRRESITFNFDLIDTQKALGIFTVHCKELFSVDAKWFDMSIIDEPWGMLYRWQASEAYLQLTDGELEKRLVEHFKLIPNDACHFFSLPLGRHWNDAYGNLSKFFKKDQNLLSVVESAKKSKIKSEELSNVLDSIHIAANSEMPKTAYADWDAYMESVVINSDDLPLE